MEDDEAKWNEKIDKLKGHNTLVSDEEIDSFLQRVGKVESILQKMVSGNKETVELAMAQADEMLGSEIENIDIAEDNIKVKKDRCCINKNAYKEEMGEQNLEMEAFKRSIETDAKRRAEDRRQRKEVAERYKNEGNTAFRSGDYNKALLSYNKALDEVKDSCVLYNNRALTLLHLGLYKRVLDDTGKALQLNESSLKALLYKAQAHHELGNKSEANEAVEEALKKHGQDKEYILEYTRDWYKEANA